MKFFDIIIHILWHYLTSSFTFCGISGLCQKGYYCPSKSQRSDQTICTKGHYCKEGSAVPEDCPAGTYNDEEGFHYFMYYVI